MSKKEQKKQRHGTSMSKSGRKKSPKDTARAQRRKALQTSAPRPVTKTAPVSELWLFGKHAVLAALNNPARQVGRLLLTKRSVEQYAESLGELTIVRPNLEAEIIPAEQLKSLLPDECVHQGITLLTTPLQNGNLKDLCDLRPNESNLVLILDQVTDPHNVGAIIRSAAAFGVRALITPERHSPPESGTLAKSASGALEIVPWIRVTNLSRCLEELAEIGYWRLGMDGGADLSLKEADFGRNIALVMGAEGKGLRKGTITHCDALIKLPIQRSVESLNVSNAAAIALYEFSTP